MNDSPEPADDQNPFKGTPFEEMFRALQNGGAGGQAPDIHALMANLTQLMKPYDGPVNWNLAQDISRKAIAAEPDPTPGRPDRDRVADSVRLADHWLDSVTPLSSGVTVGAAWSRAEWLEETLPVWKVLVEPVADHASTAMNGAISTNLPPDVMGVVGPLMGMLGKLGGTVFGQQLGQALSGLASEVLTASDIGLPLGPVGQAGLVTGNIAKFADGLDVSEDDVVLYLALREAAYQRLFAGVPWLRQHLIAAVEAYGNGITIDTSSLEEKMRDFDMNDPTELQQAMVGGLFEPQDTPQQKAALARLETTLALVEGWVDEVVGQATATRMPNAVKLQEAMRRRRASGGPAEQTFAALVGLELRPRRLRDASTLWGSLRSRQGADGRDAVWAHPDLLPRTSDLDDPLGFRTDLDDSGHGLSEDDFEAELHKLLDEGDSGPDGSATDPTQ